MVEYRIVIPARYGSSRLPGKPLLDIAGRPMIVHVCERALETGACEVVVATDHALIVEAVAELPVRALLTRPEHTSGTERIAEVSETLGWEDQVLIVNLQGDEPLIQPALIDTLAEVLSAQTAAQVATLAAPIHEREDVFNPNAVKVVTDRDGYALYFSRAPIPWHRESFAGAASALPESFSWQRHIGIYAYTAGFLRRYVSWLPSQLESIEALEQLRILWQGERIRVLAVDRPPEAGVDTETDLERVRRRFQPAD